MGARLASTATGVAATLDDLPGAALGASVGAAIFLATFGQWWRRSPGASKAPGLLTAYAGYAGGALIA